MLTASSTSYDRYYEGRKDFGTLVSHVRIFLSSFQSTLSSDPDLQVRNLSRLVWINVCVPPTDDVTRGKFPTATLTPAQLRRRKVDAVKLCVCFAYAVKHYLRGEDGLDWDDYAGILPASTARLAQGRHHPPNKDYRYATAGAGTNGKSTASAYTSYAATEHTTRRASPEAGSTGASSPRLDGADVDVERGRAGAAADATKRIRVKRSKDRKARGSKATTPLMSSMQRTLDFSADPDLLSTPLPMV